VAKRVGIDKWMFGSILLLVVVGVLMVFSASAVMAGERFGSPYHFFLRQLFWAVAGLGAMVAAMNLDYRRWRSSFWIARTTHTAGSSWAASCHSSLLSWPSPR
jgi:cell division protein FtsW